MKQPRIEEMILHEDDDLIVLSKPAGVAISTENDVRAPNLSLLLGSYAPGSRLCNRVDTDISGIVVAARSFPVFKDLAQRFRKSETTAIFHAVVWGRSAFVDHEIVWPVRLTAVKSDTTHTQVFRSVVDTRKGRPATTVVSTLASSSRFSLLSCVPLTGRRLQIRAHLTREGFPLLADPLYRGEFPFLSRLKPGYRKAVDEEERAIILRPSIHLHSLAFRLFDRDCSFEAPYPKDFAYLLKVLTKYDHLAPV
jgi:23S rRNA pseudouridine955/2504/2580 synthase